MGVANVGVRVELTACRRRARLGVRVELARSWYRSRSGRRVAELKMRVVPALTTALTHAARTYGTVLYSTCAVGKAMASATLGLGLGLILLHDASERRCAPNPLVWALLLEAGAGVSLALISPLQMRTGKHSSMLSSLSRGAALCGLISSIAAGHEDPWSAFAADVLLRWSLLWLVACAGSSIGNALLNLQLCWLYLGSLLHKSVSAYLIDAHAARSLLLTEHYDARDWPPWQLAVWVASDPWLGPALSRFAWMAECAVGAASACSALAALVALAAERTRLLALCLRARAALRAVNAFAYPAALSVASCLQLGLALTVHLSFFPYISLLLHAAAWQAARELEEAAPGARGTRPPVAQEYRPARSAAGWMMGLGGGGALIAAVFGVVPRGAWEQAWEGAAELGDEAARMLRMHQNWNMFPFDEGEPLTSGRVVAFVDFDDELAEIRLDTLRARTGNVSLDFARGAPAAERSATIAGAPFPSFRWRAFWMHAFGHRADGEPQVAARAACHAACASWLNGKLLARPAGVTLYEVVYDLPRRHGTATVAAAAASWAAHPSLPVETYGERPPPRRWQPVVPSASALGDGLEWGAWPRSLVVTELHCSECPRTCTEERQQPVDTESIYAAAASAEAAVPGEAAQAGADGSPAAEGPLALLVLPEVFATSGRRAEVIGDPACHDIHSVADATGRLLQLLEMNVAADAASAHVNGTELVQASSCLVRAVRHGDRSDGAALAVLSWTLDGEGGELRHYGCEPPSLRRSDRIRAADWARADQLARRPLARTLAGFLAASNPIPDDGSPAVWYMRHFPARVCGGMTAAAGTAAGAAATAALLASLDRGAGGDDEMLRVLAYNAAINCLYTRMPATVLQLIPALLRRVNAPDRAEGGAPSCVTAFAQSWIALEANVASTTARPELLPAILERARKLLPSPEWRRPTAAFGTPHDSHFPVEAVYGVLGGGNSNSWPPSASPAARLAGAILAELRQRFTAIRLEVGALPTSIWSTQASPLRVGIPGSKRLNRGHVPGRSLQLIQPTHWSHARFSSSWAFHEWGRLPATQDALKQAATLANSPVLRAGVFANGESIATHTGPISSKIRYHLTLSSGCARDEAPPCAWLRVGQHPPIALMEGVAIAFDDTVEHEVLYNRSNALRRRASPRMTLIVDLPHPALGAPLHEQSTEAFWLATAGNSTSDENGFGVAFSTAMFELPGR